jgi:predicted phosphodiesterase
MNPEFVLVVGDMFVPNRQSDIPQKFKTILLPNKMQHVLSLGNIGSNDNYNWLKGLSNDFHSVKGEFDEVNAPEKKVVQIGEFYNYLDASKTYRVEIHTEDGLVYKQNVKANENTLIVFETNENAKFYRVEVRYAQNNTCVAYGNPIWNTNEVK